MHINQVIKWRNICDKESPAGDTAGSILADAERNLSRLVCNHIAMLINDATKLHSCFTVDTHFTFPLGFMEILRVLSTGYHTQQHWTAF